MGTFSIKDIEAVSGIKSHTLRIWEQRYGIVSPKRTDSNIRYYDDDDLKLILNISILNRHGYKISEIAKMTKEQITETILKLTGHSTNNYDGQVKSLLSCMLSFDEYGFHKTLTTNIIQLGLETTMVRIVFPFLIEVGILWQIGSIHPSHEHFASNIIKQKLYVAIDGNVGRYAENRKRFLLFLPENEQHSIGLLFANFILRSRGHDVLYLGQEVPLEDLRSAFSNHTPDYILTLLTSAHINIDKQEFIKAIAETWPESQVLLAGIQFLSGSYKLPENARLIKRMEDFITLVDSISFTKGEVLN
ncbi:MAG: MerR family transcriptional regulator [Bacteroidia bacterium]|nr:MerR family transcriptional regulator [Bacteroidia bacterium]